MLLRAAKARNDCVPADGSCGAAKTGVPVEDPSQPCAEPDLSPPYSPVAYGSKQTFCALRDLDTAGVKLGIILGAAEGEDDGREPAEIAFHACEVAKRDTTNLFDFMFLDQAHVGTHSQRNKAVRRVVKGQVKGDDGGWKPCELPADEERGWPKLITNDTDWKLNGNRGLANYAWGHAKKVDVLEKEPKTAIDDSYALTNSDYEFIEYVNDKTDGRPILRFEVTKQSHFFAGLGKNTQCRLFREWGAAQRNGGERRHFNFIWPLYVHGFKNGDKDNPRPYASFEENTYPRLLDMIETFSPDTGEDPDPQCPGG